MLIQSIKKEAILIFNDLHSLAVLLLLPIAFMIIMTIALSEKQESMTKKITVEIINNGSSNYERSLAEYVLLSGFDIVSTENEQSKDILKKNSDVTLTINAGFDDALLLRQGNGHIMLNINEQVSPQVRLMIKQLISVSLSKLKLHAYMDSVGDFDGITSLNEQSQLVTQSADVSYLLASSQEEKAIEQPTLFSIPSWIVFGIYFIVLPISIALINERQNGTLVRIKTYPISTTGYFINKAMSYSILSVIQFILLSIVGLCIIPLILAEPPLIITQYGWYALSGVGVVVSAISFAFLLASLVNSFDQAMVLGGGVNIILAALSGFMVPIDVMPDAMKTIATLSPMYWASELIRQSLSSKEWELMLINFSMLCAFSVVCFTAALVVFNRKSRKLLWN